MDRRFDLATREADVAQFAIVEFAKSFEGGATAKIVRDVTRPGVEKPSCISAGSHRDRRPEQR